MKRNLFILLVASMALTTLSLGCGDGGNGVIVGSNPNGGTTTTVYSGCTKDTDCGDAKKCVLVEGYAVCAKSCASDPTVCGTQKCDERDKKEGGGKEKVCVTPSSASSVTAPRTSKEGETCDKTFTCEKGLICVADIHGPGDPSDKGTCQKLKECDGHDTCKNDANAPQCLYVMDVEKKEHRVCGKCDGFKFHCEYGTEVCVGQPPSLTTGLCKPRCFEDKDCSTPGTKCRGASYPSTQGEICRNPKEAGYHEPCNKKSSNEIECSEGFVCVSHDSTTPSDGICEIKCSIDSNDKESKECSPDAPYCAQADISGDPSPTKGLACSPSPTGSSTPPGPTRTGKEGDTCTKSELCDNNSSFLVCIANERHGEEGTCHTGCYTDTDCGGGTKKCKHVDSRAFSVKDFGSPKPLGLTVGYCVD